MIGDFLNELHHEARRARVDTSRLAVELNDHLQQSTSAYEAAGRPRAEAEALAVADLGDPKEIVWSMATMGGTMTRTRVATLVFGLFAMAAVWMSHIGPPSELAGTGMEPVAIVGMGTMLLTTALLLATSNRIAGIVAVLLGGGVTWAFATSALRDHGILITNVSFTLGVAGATAGALCFVAHIRGGLGIAAMAAGLAALVLNGSWEELGGFGGGSANIGVILFTIGWCWFGANLIPSALIHDRADRVRGIISSVLQWAARKIEPAQLS